MESEGNIPSEPSLLYLNLYATFEEVLKIELPQCRNIAFTLEEWTSRAGHGYLSLTIHYINREFEMRKFTVGCRRTEGKKDDVGLAFNLRSMITSIPGDNACELNYILTLRTKERVALLKKSGTHCEFCKLTSGSFDNNKRFCCWQTFLPNLWRVLLFLRIAEEVISFLCLMWINYMDALNQDLREIQQWQSWRMPVHQWERALSTANA